MFDESIILDNGKRIVHFELSDYDYNRLLTIHKTTGSNIKNIYTKALYDYYIKYGPWIGYSSGGGVIK